MNNTMVKKVVSALSIVLVIALVQPAMAFDGGKEKTTNSPSLIEVKHLGTIDSKDLIRIQFDNSKGEDLSLIIKDTDGNELYSEDFSDTKFSKKFLLNMPDFDQQKIEVTVTSKNSGFTQTYNINKEVKEINEIVVTAVK
jgi:hypothetical protein